MKLLDLEQEKDAIAHYFKCYSDIQPNRHASLLLDSEYHELLSNHLLPAREELLQWNRADYQRLTDFDDQLIHKTASGTYVRSKSEVLIDMVLYQNKIPFHYEEKLILGQTTLYPDFTIRHPKTGQFFYWEHFGMMDDPKYLQNTCAKMSLYLSSHIYPGVQLITTYESSSCPLTLEVIENIVHQYFK